MIDDAVLREIERFDAGAPLEQATGPPASWYTRADFYEAERRSVFARNWLVAARTDQVAEPGQYVTTETAGEPTVVVRGEDRQLRAFANVCRHRAAGVASGDGTCRQFVCPYHGWTYGLDGRLQRAPELGAVQNFDRETSGLIPLATQTWAGFMLVSQFSPSPPLPAYDELLRRLTETGYEQLTFVERRTYTLECNWKVFVDNYLDGGYHVAVLHQGLAAQLSAQTYHSELFDGYSIQSCQTSSAAEQPAVGNDFRERLGDAALYAWVYPNFMINRYGPVMDTNLVLPLGPDRCQVVFDFYFAETAGESAAAFIRRSIDASQTVQDEDTAICQQVQQGMNSQHFLPGRYSVAREAPMHHFHRLLAADLRRFVM